MAENRLGYSGKNNRRRNHDALKIFLASTDLVEDPVSLVVSPTVLRTTAEVTLYPFGILAIPGFPFRSVLVTLGYGTTVRVESLRIGNRCLGHLQHASKIFFQNTVSDMSSHSMGDDGDVHRPVSGIIMSSSKGQGHIHKLILN
jgi:hypothetical protein